jgi:hypothetical protein
MFLRHLVWCAEFMLEIDLKFLLTKTGARLILKIELISLHIDPDTLWFLNAWFYGYFFLILKIADICFASKKFDFVQHFIRTQKYCEVSIAEWHRCARVEFYCVFDTQINYVQSFIAKTRRTTIRIQLFIKGILVFLYSPPRYQGNLLLNKPLRTSMVYGICFHETPILIDFIHMKETLGKIYKNRKLNTFFHSVYRP